MRVAMISPEIAPFAKTGGLADVVGTLAAALERYGHELYLIMPAYRSVLRNDFALEQTEIKLAVPLSDKLLEASVLTARLGRNISVYFLRADQYFDREFLYGTPQGDYPDNAERFVFFGRAALEILRHQPVDIVHCHDWQSALAIVFLSTQADRYPESAAAKTVFTVHNLGFQGIFPQSDWHLLNLERSYFSLDYLEFYANINFLKGALIFADRITVVSPTYAREIMDREQGFGLDGVLRRRAADLVGILNGVDYGQWNPWTDPFISPHYGQHSLSVKRRCKKSLQKSVGLRERSSVPLIGIISRLTSQKGFDLVEKIFHRLMQRDLQVVVLGSGEPRYEEFFARAAERHPQQVAVRIGFDETLAHQIEAGADIFLMPSLYEPCGLTQMRAQRYGALPIGRTVGGLADTIEDEVSGFLFDGYSPDAFDAAVRRALALYADRDEYQRRARGAMRRDFNEHREMHNVRSLNDEHDPTARPPHDRAHSLARRCRCAAVSHPRD